MVKKLLSPIYVGALILVLVLGSITHLMYGSCQTSKWHYIVQNYHMPSILPKWMLIKERFSSGEIKVYKNYTGKWMGWYKDGKKRYLSYILKGEVEGRIEEWYPNGTPQLLSFCKNGKRSGKHIEWHENGQKRCEIIYKENKEISSEFWYEDGSQDNY